MAPSDITGVILAGGLARRMGGVDKGLQNLHGKTLVERVAERLAPQVDQLLINVNRQQAAYAQFGYRLIGDRLADFPGPLAGLQAALSEAKTPFVLSVPCDSPYLPLDLAERLGTRLQQTGAALAIAMADGRQHPVFCLCRTGLADALAAYLHGGGRRVMQWCAEAGAQVVDFSDQAAAFRNFNTLEDLRADETSEPAQH